MLRERLQIPFVRMKLVDRDAKICARFSDTLWREMDLQCGPDYDQNSDPDGR